MNWLYSLHNDYLLWFIQEIFYGYALISALVMIVLLVCLPTHRRSGAALGWAAVAWAALCLLAYNALGEAPALAMLLIVLLVYRAVRAILWLLPSDVSGGDQLRSVWWRARAGWARWLLQQYVLEDPRCVYLMDMARAVRGLPMQRGRKDRAALSAEASVDAVLPPSMRPLVFGLIEARIWLYRRLPAYWHRPHLPLDLHEPMLANLLDLQATSARRHMMRSWTADDFVDYCSRDPLTHQRERQRAAAYGRQYIAHREALAEYASFRTPWQPGEPGLWETARLCFDTWRQRRQFDRLWFESSGDPATALTNQEIQSLLVATEDTSAPQDSDLSLSADRSSADGNEPPRSADQWQDSLKLTDYHGDERTGSQNNSDDDRQSSGNLLFRDMLARHQHKEAEESEDEQYADEDVEADTDDQLQEMRTDRTASGQVQEVQEQPLSISDEELFAATAEEDDRAVDALQHAEPSEPLQKLSVREQQRHGDLRTACRALQAFLDVPATDSFVADVIVLERMLGNPQRAAPAVMLLMLYCLRKDFANCERERVDLLIRLSDRFGGEMGASQPYRDARRLFYSMRVEVLMERGDYAQVVEHFSHRDDLSRYEWKLLAEAEAAMARNLAGRDELREMLRFDAIGHFFRAGFCGLWTLEYAEQVLDHVNSVEQMAELLRGHAVEITHPGPLRLGSARSRPAASFAPASPKITLLISTTTNVTKQHRVQVSSLPCTFGSDPQKANFRLIAPGVAPAHVRLMRHEGNLAVIDLTRSASLTVNGRTAMQGAKVKRGDRIQFGNVIIELAQVQELASV